MQLTHGELLHPRRRCKHHVEVVSAVKEILIMFFESLLTIAYEVGYTSRLKSFKRIYYCEIDE